jgi:hypothetical protein
MSVGGIFRPGMRAYFVPLVAGLLLAASAFLPWVIIGEVTMTGMPDTIGYWVVGLGATAALLALLSLITRKNSRHPLLLVGLVALGVMFLSWRLMPRLVADRLQTHSQAVAIVEDIELEALPDANVGGGIYLGLAAASAIAGFGFTIVIKRAHRPYIVESKDDDV